MAWKKFLLIGLFVLAPNAGAVNSPFRTASCTKSSSGLFYLTLVPKKGAPKFKVKFARDQYVGGSRYSGPRLVHADGGPSCTAAREKALNPPHLPFRICACYDGWWSGKSFMNCYDFDQIGKATRIVSDDDLEFDSYQECKDEAKRLEREG